VIPWNDLIPKLARAVPDTAWVLEVRGEESKGPKPEQLARLFDRFAEIQSEPRA